MIVNGCFSRIQKMLGRNETRTRDRMYCQTMRTVRDISRDETIEQELRPAVCDRLKENCSIDDTFNKSDVTEEIL